MPTSQIRLIRPLLVSLAVLGVVSVARALTSPPQANPKVDAIFATMDKPGSPGCAVAVMREGAIVYSRGYGTANLEYDVPITASSIFHVASVSKQFTAAAVALLAADGRLSLDDDVRKYVPEVPDFGTRITLRHLAQHTSGLRDQWDLLALAGWRWESDVVTTGDVLDITARQTALNFTPGAEYLYSNTGFTLLGVVVERVSGKSLRDFARERIFEPLGMRSTHFHDDHQMIVRNRAYAYAPGRGVPWRQSIPDFDTVGATSLFTTVEDLARWDRNFSTKQVGGEALAVLQAQRGVLNDGRPIAYSFGLVHGEYRGLRTVSHGGSDAGYRAHFLRFPDEQLSIAVLCNYPASGPARLAERVAEVYAGARMLPEVSRSDGSPAPGPPAGLTRDEIRRLDGFYVDPSTDIPVRLAVRNGRLTLARGQEEPLVPDGARRFRTPSGSVAVEVQSMAGWPVRLRLTTADGHVAELASAPASQSTALDDYTGVYHSDELGTDYVVERQDDGLALRHRKLGTERLKPVFRDVFSQGSRSVTFRRDQNGHVTGFTISTPRVRKVRFVRVR
jgi:CubicO group peptidase (beta-lactamase class C family)